jgi:Flp pilus assembly protein TadG
MSTMHTDVAMRQPTATKQAQSQKGSMIVEFALILLLFFGLIFAIIDLSVVFYDKTVLTMAIQKGARAGAIASTGHEAEAERIGNDACRGNLISFGAVEASPVTASKSGDTLTVTASFNYEAIGPFRFYPLIWPLSPKTSMMLESP